ncbi:MAG TPA: GntR family transcriptional regulator [Steroidobacteraceae bacterium]|nr:GntR family transcriptional regulator [Steroidobacteraceae bacterium]
MSDAPVKRTCMRDQIRDRLIARILDGTYPAGTQLKELTLAREFNVSQAPIREALRELEGSGLVRSERYRGTRVLGADPGEMRESYELRTMLEVRSVELAVPCSPEIMADLSRCVATMSSAANAEDSERYIDAALQFHRGLVRASGNRTFLNVWDSLHWDVRGRVALRRIAEQGRGLRPFVRLHRTLLSRLRARKAREAAASARAILERVSAVFSPE